MKVMKTIYNVKTLCVLTMLAVAGTIQAQEDNLKRELTLEREYDPSVQDANKINTLPEVKQPDIKKTAIEYATQTVPTDPKTEISILPSGKIMTDILYNKHRGYFNVGVATNLNINGDFGYHILNTKHDKLNLFFSHRSSSDERTFLQEDDLKQDVHMNDNLGGLNYQHHFGKSELKLGVRYGYSSFNYFGFNDSLQIAEPVRFSKDTKQVNQQIGFNAGIESEEGAALGYLLDFDYINFSHKYGLVEDIDGIKENTIGVKAGMNALFGGNQSIGVLGKLEYLNYSLPTGIEDLEFENHAEITLTPYYTVEGDIWKIKLGANVMFVTGKHDKLFASPNIKADVTVADKTVLYLDADGKLESNSAYELSLRNRYVNPWEDVRPSRTWLDGKVGLKSGVAPGFWFDVFAGYKATDEDVLFSQIIEHNYINYSKANYFNTKNFFAGATLKYDYQDQIEFTLQGVFNNWTVNEEKESGNFTGKIPAFGRPKAEITSTIDVRPIDKLTISAKYYLATGREGLFEAPYVGLVEMYNKTISKMDNINELNVTGLYAVTSNVGVYGQLNNLLFQKYDLYYGYPTQGFNVMVGVNINF